MRKKNPHAFISINDSERAIYIDFEGFQDKSPALLGILFDGKFEQVVFDPELRSAAIENDIRVGDLKGEMFRLTDLCKKDSRLLVAYSQHELNVIMNYAKIDVTDTYRDARMIAKKWKNKCNKKSAHGCRTLKDYLAFIGYERPGHLGEKKSTSRIKAVRDMLSKKGEYGSLTPVVKAKWTKLLDHNEIDCRGMEALVQKAAKETEEAD